MTTSIPVRILNFSYVKPTILTKLEIKAKFRAKQASFYEMQNLKNLNKIKAFGLSKFSLMYNLSSQGRYDHFDTCPYF